MIIGSIRNSNASLDDIPDLFSKEPRKDKQRKCNKDEKWQSKKERRENKLIPYLICFLVLFGKMALGEETRELFEMNRIQKGNLKPLRQNALSGEIINNQIDNETFKAYKCEEENVSTAKFSINPPPECRRED